MPNATPSLDTILCEAVGIADADARAAYLDRACGPDAGLRQRVEALIEAHFRAGSFLDRPAGADATAGFGPGADTTAAPVPGTMIGPYKLMEMLGEGGMGSVYVAEQSVPVKRRVALKVIKPGMDTREVVARFEAERQALALMDHPNIARVLDAGATEQGRPYFVMELVRGLTVTEYCDQARLPADRRLRLFAQVCRAVQHAHQKGVIHRDLKPSNVLVTLHDGEPVPKVIDFGIAKAVGQRLTDKTVYTRLAQFVGSPLYMSPEQAELSGLDVDTRSDVYSLGVLLYELLTGTTPFDAETFRQVGLDEVRRMIREHEPLRPSARVSTLGAEARSTVSARRRLDDRQLGRLLRGDLDWVVMKALEKDRKRRYESAGLFAADVERYLADEPVVARPPSALYRLRKFVRRNKVGVAVVVIVAATVAALAGGAGYVVRDRTARIAATQQKVAETLASARTAVESGDLALAGQRAAEANGHLGEDRDRLAGEAADIDRLQREIADRQADEDRFRRFVRLATDAQDRMGYDFGLAGDRVAEEALGIFGVLSDDGWLSRLDGSYLTAAQKQQVRETAYVTLVSLADFLVRWNNRTNDPGAAPRGLELLRLAEAFHRPTRAFYFVRSGCYRLLGDKAAADADQQRHLQAPAESAWDHYLPGHTAGWEGDIDEAIRAYRSALAVQPDHYNSLFFLASRLATRRQEYREAIGLYTGCIALRPDHVWAWESRAECYEKLGDRKAAEADYTTAVERSKTDRDRSRTLQYRAKFLEKLGRVNEAEADYTAMVKRAKTDQDRIYALPNRAQFFERLSDRKAAEADYTAAVEQAQTDEGRVRALEVRASFFKQLGRKADADEDYQRLIDNQTRLVERAAGASRAGHLHRRAIYYCWLGRYDRTVEDCTRAVELAPEIDNCWCWSTLGAACVASGDPAAAREATRKAVELKPYDLEHWCTHATVLLLAGDVEGYQQVCKRVLERYGETKDQRKAYLVARICTLAPGASADPARLVRIAQLAVDASSFDRDCNLHALGIAHYRAGQFEQAVERLSQVAEHNPDWDGNVCNWLALAMAHHRLGHAAEARQWLDKAVHWIENTTAKALWQAPIGPSMEIHMHNWLAYRLLLREAEALINGQPAKP